MQLSDGEDASEHGVHGVVVQRGGGEPQRGVGHTAALGVKVEHVGALPHQLRTEDKAQQVNGGQKTVNGHRKASACHSPLGEIKLIEPDGAAKRVFCVLHHLQDVLFILLLFLPFSRNSIGL